MLLQLHTKEQIERFTQKPTHGVLLSGPEGAGKVFVARFVASGLLVGTPPGKLENYPYFRVISPEKGSLGIGQIRELQKFLQLKVPGADGIRRIAVIEDAHLMTVEAQNALLKSLEEPPADTVVILTAPASQSIKDTIYSRVRQIQVLPVDREQASAYFGRTYDKPAVERAYLLSGGHIGLMHALLNDEDHALAQEIKRAKEIFGLNRYERLARVEELSKAKDALPLFLQAGKLIASTALHQAVGKNAADQVRRWHRALATLNTTEAALPSNPNAKLLLTDLMLHL